MKSSSDTFLPGTLLSTKEFSHKILDDFITKDDFLHAIEYIYSNNPFYLLKWPQEYWNRLIEKYNERRKNVYKEYERVIQRVIEIMISENMVSLVSVLLKAFNQDHFDTFIHYEYIILSSPLLEAAKQCKIEMVEKLLEHILDRDHSYSRFMSEILFEKNSIPELLDTIKNLCSFTDYSRVLRSLVKFLCFYFNPSTSEILPLFMNPSLKKYIKGIMDTCKDPDTISHWDELMKIDKVNKEAFKEEYGWDSENDSSEE